MDIITLPQTAAERADRTVTNHQRTHQGKMCCGRTPFETMIDGKEIWQEKFVN
jgi:hypothetical protein